MSFSFLLRRDGLNRPDFRISGGRLVISSGSDAVRDRLFTALSTQLGEWFLDDTDGVPYMAYGPSPGILGGKMTEAEVSALLRRRILLDPDVLRVVSMQVEQNSRRQVTVTAEVLLSTSDIITLKV